MLNAVGLSVGKQHNCKIAKCAGEPVHETLKKASSTKHRKAVILCSKCSSVKLEMDRKFRGKNRSCSSCIVLGLSRTAYTSRPTRRKEQKLYLSTDACTYVCALCKLMSHQRGRRARQSKQINPGTHDTAF